MAIRRNPDAACWSWALEWNHNLRIIGFFGDEEAAAETIRSFRIPQSNAIGDSGLNIRLEVPLEDEQDSLFRWTDDDAADSDTATSSEGSRREEHTQGN